MNSGGSMSSACTTSSDSQRVRESDGSLSSNTTIVANGVGIFSSGANMLPVSTITATCNRVKHFSGSMTSTSGTNAIGREKWEVVPPAGATWDTIAESSDTWTNITETSTTWTDIAA